MAGAALLQLAACYAAPLQALLGTEPLAAGELLVAAMAAVVPGSVLALLRRPARTRSVR